MYKGKHRAKKEAKSRESQQEYQGQHALWGALGARGDYPTDWYDNAVVDPDRDRAGGATEHVPEL